MANPVQLPKLGNTVEECFMGTWRKKAGDQVDEGEILVDVETDKTNYELEAPATGTLLEIFFDEGELVPVMTNIAVIGNKGDDYEEHRPKVEEPETSKQEAPAPSEKTVSDGADKTSAEPKRSSEQSTTSETKNDASGILSKRARTFCAQHYVPVEKVNGSGPNGLITETDVKNYYYRHARISSLAHAKVREEGYVVKKETGSGPNGMILDTDLRKPGKKLSTIRKTIASRMMSSLSTTAQYTVSSSVNAGQLLALRKKLKTQEGAVSAVNINHLILYATVLAVKKHPEFNTQFIDNEIHTFDEIELGFACDTPDGLMVPVVKNAESTGIVELAMKVKELSTKALEKTIQTEDLEGGTFTVSNLGSMGIDSFTPIINAPQVAILGVCNIETKPFRKDGDVVFADFIKFSLTCDHQIIDGALAAKFLITLKEILENIEEHIDIN